MQDSENCEEALLTSTAFRANPKGRNPCVVRSFQFSVTALPGIYLVLRISPCRAPASHFTMSPRTASSAAERRSAEIESAKRLQSRSSPNPTIPVQTIAQRSSNALTSTRSFTSPLSPCPYLSNPPNPSPDLRLTQFNAHPTIPKVSIQTPTRLFTGPPRFCAIAPLSLTIIMSHLTPSVRTLSCRHTQVEPPIQQQPLQRNLGQTLSDRN